MATTTEISKDVYRISVFVPEINLEFSHFLVRDDEPLLFHTGLRSMFPVLPRGALASDRHFEDQAHWIQPLRIR